jgi:hypothetical protein
MLSGHYSRLKQVLDILVSTTIKFDKFIAMHKTIKQSSYLKLYAHLRYFLEGDRPSQTNKLKPIQIYL